jgi:hypothetical protein
VLLLLPPQAGNKSYVGAVTYAPPGFLPGLENGAVISGVCVWQLMGVETRAGQQQVCAGSLQTPLT